jgi:predicted small lipoprotein YifL
MAVDVDHVILQPPVERGFDRRQHRLRARLELAVGERVRCRSGRGHGRYNASMCQSGSVAMPPARKKAPLPLTLPGLLALLAMGLAATACGQKGPLVLPKAAPAASAASATR